MILPHRVLEEGRILAFDRGPITERDFLDTIWHVRRTHEGTRRRVEDIFISADQALILQETPLFAGGAPPRIMGMAIHIGLPEHTLRGMLRATGEFMHPRTLERDQETWYRQITHNITATRATGDPIYIGYTMDQAQWVYDGAIRGAKVNGMWLDEKKPVPSSHEIW